MSNEELLFNIGSDEATYDKLKEDFQEWTIKNKVSIEEINCDDFIFTKILQGDKSDNIKSVVSWEKRTASGKIRNFSITEKQAIKILEQYKKEEGDFKIDHFFNKERVNKLVDIIYRVTAKSTINEIKIRFNQNLDLMLLHYNTIPEPIQKQIFKSVEQDEHVMPNIPGLSQMEKILEGTNWTSKKSTGAPKQFDAFDGLKASSEEMPKTKRLNELF